MDEFLPKSSSDIFANYGPFATLSFVIICFFCYLIFKKVRDNPARNAEIEIIHDRIDKNNELQRKNNEKINDKMDKMKDDLAKITTEVSTISTYVRAKLNGKL